MNKFLVAAFFLVISGVGFFFYQNSIKTQSQNIPAEQTKTPTPTPVENIDSLAAFAIYTNGTLRVFTDSRYHNKSEDVYLEADNPNVVHVKKSGLTWGDFFKTLPMKLEKDCLTTGTGQVFCSQGSSRLKFYINGVEDKGALDKEIKNEDQLLVSYGNDPMPDIKRQIQAVREITN